MDNVVTRREFFRNPYKYIGNLPVIITNHGEADLMLMKYEHAKPKVSINGEELKVKTYYGCGCETVDNKKLCLKHGRN